jgi:glyoxylase I family protein
MELVSHRHLARFLDGCDEQDVYILGISHIDLTVMTHDVTPETGAFDERRVRLDHLAFRVADRDELQRWVTHLEAKGVTHEGIIDIGYGPTVLFRDPDNMRLELYVHQSIDEMQLTAADSEEAKRLTGGAVDRRTEAKACLQSQA